jgi:hypothetical protein
VGQVLEPNGKFIANIIFKKYDSGESNWDYPKARYHSIKTVKSLANEAGLKMEITKIKHPAPDKYTWVVFTHNENNKK